MENNVINILPLISIVVPIYNGEEYLEYFFVCFESQTYPNLELVLINDGSIDKTRKICQDYVKKEENKKKCLYNQPNRGVSAARNLGLEKSKGDYIVFADIDDYMYPTYVEDLYNVLQKYDADISCCVAIKVNDRYNPITYEKYNLHKNKKEICFNRELAIEDFAYRKHINGLANSKLIKRSLGEQVRFEVGLKFGEDYLYSYELLKKCNRIAFVNVTEYLYIQRKKSATHVKNDNAEEFYKTWNMLLGVLKETMLMYPNASDGVREKCYMQAIRFATKISDGRKYGNYQNELYQFMKKNGMKVWKDKKNRMLNKSLGLLGCIMPKTLCVICKIMLENGFILRHTI